MLSTSKQSSTGPGGKKGVIFDDGSKEPVDDKCPC
jgi:hypothetical protein